MRRTLVTLTIIFSCIFFYLTPNQVAGVSIEQVGKIGFMDKSELQIVPRSFCVTEDGLVLIPDHISGYIKLFELIKADNELRLVKKFGEKGVSDTEFEKPSYCYYNVQNAKFCVIDVGTGPVVTRKVIVFDRINKFDFVPITKIPFTGGYDIRIGNNGHELIVSGYTTHNGESYELYSVDMINSQKQEYLLKSFEKYGLTSEGEYRRKYFEEKEIPALGIEAFIDMWGDDIYFVWSPKLRILKINLKTQKKTIFGGKIKPTNFEKADVLSELYKAYNNREYIKYNQIKNQKSFIKGIFATKKQVFLVYEGPGKGKLRLLIYSTKGQFLGDCTIPGNFHSTYQSLWFEKESLKLYSLVTAPNKEAPQILILQVKF